MIFDIIQLLAGVYSLYYFSNLLIDNGSLLASRYNIPKIFIGLTLVAFGTSLPEFIVSMVALYNGELDIVPCVPHPMTSGNTITFFTQASGYGTTQIEARKDAMKTATESLMRQNNLLLVASGIKNKNSHMRSWVRLKENQTTITPG